MMEMLLALTAGAVSECNLAMGIQSPRPGSVVVYDLGGVTTFGNRVGATRAGVTRYEEFHYGQAADGKWVVGRGGADFDAVFGAIPVGTRTKAFERRRQFQSDPATALSRLEPGQTVKLSGYESFSQKGKRIRDERPVTAKFIGCFTEEFAGTTERILKYELHLPGIGRRGKAEDDIGLVETTAVVGISPSLGWLVTYQSKTGSFRAKWIGSEIPSTP